MSTTESSTKRAAVHLDIAQHAIQLQVQQQEKTIQRLQNALVTKKDILEDCQELLTGPLRSAFATGGGPTAALSSSWLSSSSTIPEVDNADLFKRVRDRRRKRIMERLVPIVGDTVAARSFQPDEELEPRKDVEQDYRTGSAIDTYDSTAGWIEFKSRIIVWVGTRCQNISGLHLRNLSLSVALQETKGHIVSSLAPKESCSLISVIDVDDLSILDDEEYKHPQKLVERILARPVLVHYSSVADEIKDKAGITGGQPTLSSVSIPDFAVGRTMASRWQTVLEKIILPARYAFQLNRVDQDEFERVFAEEFEDLSHEPQTDTFGSIEEELIVSLHQELDLKTEQQNLRVVVSATTESLAYATARKSLATWLSSSQYKHTSCLPLLFVELDGRGEGDSDEDEEQDEGDEQAEGDVIVPAR
ncbi:hypothetical protein BGZ83_009396 [Gryganskiella cystojenkinii]|nr:hypothetical protein BGZ83_009396 [Gryganskiella cystojenkinii]